MWTLRICSCCTDVTGGGDYIVDVKPNWNLKTKPDHHVPATKDTVPATTDTVPATTDTVPATTDIVTLEETTRPAACKIVPRRLGESQSQGEVQNSQTVLSV